MLDWNKCSTGRSVVDFMPIFSDRKDEAAFHQRWLEMGATSDKPWMSLVAQPLPDGANPGSWKKLEGLAQVLQYHNGNYEFALMLDAEISLGNCSAFAGLLSSLKQKHETKIWYGAQYAGSERAHLSGAADALVLS